MDQVHWSRQSNTPCWCWRNSSSRRAVNCSIGRKHRLHGSKVSFLYFFVCFFFLVKKFFFFLCFVIQQLQLQLFLKIWCIGQSTITIRGASGLHAPSLNRAFGEIFRKNQSASCSHYHLQVCLKNFCFKQAMRRFLKTTLSMVVFEILKIFKHFFYILFLSNFTRQTSSGMEYRKANLCKP